MRNKVMYEWCIEHYTDDEFQDITNHDFSDKLDFSDSDLEPNKGEKTRLVLIRDGGNDFTGLEDRCWAYVKDNQLPIFFTDSTNESIGYRVPKKFHKELSVYLKNKIA